MSHEVCLVVECVDI